MKEAYKRLVANVAVVVAETKTEAEAEAVMMSQFYDIY